ncbi:unnamed protein product [Polarella glacialis]|uniref:SET domain-containing protein n=1 Tax=Polarella glacialis TaxID=89957 RepID=A0A813H4H8_POLGL|nr:unnamed protein product [Polarella glacialis]
MTLAEVPDMADVAELDACTVQRVVLIWSCNSHAFMGGAALFLNIPKLNHVCGGRNTCYTVNDQMKQGETVAMRDVCEGEELTTSYLLCLTGTAERRRQPLSSKYFHCACNFCRCAPDRLAALRCPSCKSSGWAMEEFLTSVANNNTNMDCSKTRQLLNQANLTNKIRELLTPACASQPGRLLWWPSDGIWRCDSCQLSWDDEALASQVPGHAARSSFEAQAANELQEFRCRLRRGSLCQDLASEAMHSEAVAVRRLLKTVLDTLGPWHWLPYAVLRVLADAGSLSAEELLLAALANLVCTAVASWRPG